MTVLMGATCMLLSGCPEAHDVQAGQPTLPGADSPGATFPGLEDGQGGPSTLDGNVVDGQAGAGGQGQQPPAGAVGGGCGDCGPPAEVPVLGTVATCCTTDNECGYELGAVLGTGDNCLEQDAPGQPDASCPPYDLMGFVTLDGCCRPDGMCGINDTFLGLGCTINPDGGGSCGGGGQGQGGGGRQGGGRGQ